MTQDRNSTSTSTSNSSSTKDKEKTTKRLACQNVIESKKQQMGDGTRAVPGFLRSLLSITEIIVRWPKKKSCKPYNLSHPLSTTLQT